MTHPNGFILLVGCPRQKEIRKSIEIFKYFEFNENFISDNDHSVVLIPKNQALTTKEALIQLKNLPEKLLAIIQQTVKSPAIHENLEFCTIPYKNFPTIGERLFNISPEDKAETIATLISDHRQGQCRIRKRVTSHIENKITNYLQLNPNLAYQNMILLESVFQKIRLFGRF